MLVVVDTDASLQRAVVRVGAAAGLEVVVCATARAAFNACCALSPDCLVVAVSPADHEGFWLLAAIRARPEEASAMPLVALAARDAGAHSATMTRIQALEAGADVVLQKPIETSELIAQVKALTKMAARVRARRDVLFDPDGLGVVAGDLDLEPVSEVLRALEARRWSGALELGDRGFASRVLSITIGDGALLGGHLGDRELAPVEALREALAWSGRRFEFFPGPAPVDDEGAASLAELLQSLLSTPGAEPLGGHSDDDLPEVSARRPSPPPAPTLDATSASPLPATIASDAVTPSPSPIASRNQAPGRNLVESVRQSSRPDPRAESDS
jgi:DNA-binding response OmpR family regulator